MLRTYHPLQRSDENWYLVSVLIRIDVVGSRPSQTPGSEPLSLSENRILIQAASPLEALEKASLRAKLGEYQYLNEDGIELECTFQGFTHLVPVHDEPGDGCEIEWLDRTGMTNEAISRYVAGSNPADAFKSFDLITEDQPDDFPRTPEI